MAFSIRIAGLAVAFGLIGSALMAANESMTPKQRFAQALSFQAEAPEKTILLLQALADEGDARALDRLAFFTFKGIGTDKDVARAIALYNQAIEAGRTSSRVSLGKVYLTTGAHKMALDTLTKASEQGHGKADAVLAWAHATLRLGALSEPAAGFNALRDLAQADIREAQMYLLDATARNQRSPDNIDHVIDRLHARHTDGDAKAAEALLRFYRMRGHTRGTVQVRAVLLETQGLRDKIRVEEGLYLAAERWPNRFWGLAEELVQNAPPEVYARALSVAARINRNAYVRIVQQELREHGYKVGPRSPYMNRPLIRAINKFCRDTGLNEACRQGPLKSTTIKAVAGKLAELRNAS